MFDLGTDIRESLILGQGYEAYHNHNICSLIFINWKDVKGRRKRKLLLGKF